MTEEPLPGAPVTPPDPPMAEYEPLPWHPVPPQPPLGPLEPDAGLLGIRIGVGRALLAVFALVGLTDLSLLAAAFGLREFGPVPGWVRGLVLSAVILVGYSIGLVAAVLITDPERVPFFRAYGFRRLSQSVVALAVGVSVLVRLLGGVWSAILLGFKIQLPGMNVDPSALLGTGPVAVVLTFVLFAGLAPFVEEVGFRGIVMGSLSERMRLWPANLISAFLFAMVHVNLWAAVPVFIAGLGFGWLFGRTKTLWAPVIAHAAFNAMGLVVAYAFKGLGPM